MKTIYILKAYHQADHPDHSYHLTTWPPDHLTTWTTWTTLTSLITWTLGTTWTDQTIYQDK